jgi:hypothetical protein
MVSATIYNRTDIKENISKVFTSVEVKDYGMARNAAEQLRDALLKYYLTRGINPTHFYDLFESLEYDILYATNNHFKKEIIYDTMHQIIEAIRTSTKDPLMRLKEIYDDIRHLVIDIDKSKIPELLECFDEINQLKPEFDVIGGTASNYYANVMIKVGDCESAMMRVAQSRPSDSLFSMLQDTFKGFYEAVHRLISPPVRLQISKEEIYDIYKKQGVPTEEIATATGINEEELRIIIQKEDFLHQDENEGE